MSNMEKALNIFAPYVVRSMVLIGAIASLLSVTITVFFIAKKEIRLKDAGLYLMKTLGFGLLISMAGIFFNYMYHFEIDFSNFKMTIPASYAISLLIFVLFMKHLSKNSVVKEVKVTVIDDYEIRQEENTQTQNYHVTIVRLSDKQVVFHAQCDQEQDPHYMLDMYKNFHNNKSGAEEGVHGSKQ